MMKSEVTGTRIASSYSLTDLPLNVLFQILLNLSLEELQPVSRTCKILRSLANENYIYRNNLNDKNIRSNMWTQKLMVDVFNIFNNSRNIIEKLNYQHNISVLGSIRIIQKKYNLGFNPIKKEIEDKINCLLESNHIDPRYLTANVDNNSNKAENYLQLQKSTKKKTLNYLEIFQGSHSFASNNQFDSLKEEQNSNDVDSIVSNAHSDNNKIINEETDDNSFCTQIQDMEPLTRYNAQPVGNTSLDTEYDYSKSPANSLFSDVTMKLSDQGTNSSIYEIDAGNDSDITNRSNGFTCQLRTSKKVKDRAALFEKLFSEDSSLTEIVSNNDNYNAFVSSLPTISKISRSSTRRNISQGYLEELDRFNSRDESLGIPKLDMDNTFNEKKHIRRKLKAVIKENNKISYEKI